MQLVLGEERIRLLFNYVAQVSMVGRHDFDEVRAIVESLATANKDIGEAGEGYEHVVIEESSLDERYAVDIMKHLIPVQYRELYGAKHNKLREVTIFWLYPDFIVFNGRKDAIESAVVSFVYHLKTNGVELSLHPPRFDWVYFMHLFSIRMTRKLWQRQHNVYDEGYAELEKPSVEIAQGTILNAIHDASSEWDVESDQAKRVSAKDAGDSTEDLATLISLLGGRKLNGVLLYVTMEKQSRFVRLSEGGRICILRKYKEQAAKDEQKKRKHVDRTAELARLAWGLEFAKRVNKAYINWFKRGEDRVPSNQTYVDIDSEVRRKLKPVLDRGCPDRITELEDERKRIRES